MGEKVDAVTIERLFCLAILPEGTDAVARILGRFLNYRQLSDEVLAGLGCKGEKKDG